MRELFLNGITLIHGERAVDFSAVSKAIGIALKSKDGSEFAKNLQTQMKVTVATFTQALDEHSEALKSLSPDQVGKVLGFLSKQAFNNFPKLKSKLSPDQQHKMGLASYAAVEEILAAEPEKPAPLNIPKDFLKDENLLLMIKRPFFLGQGNRNADKAREGDAEAQARADKFFKLAEQIKDSKYYLTNRTLMKKIEEGSGRRAFWTDKTIDFVRELSKKYPDPDKLPPDEAFKPGMDTMREAVEDLLVDPYGGTKKPVFNSYSTLEWILAESSDRAAKPSNDVINEVQPLKWKKAPHGQAQPQNLPMNPDAKKVDAPMDGLPENYPALAKVLKK